MKKRFVSVLLVTLMLVTLLVPATDAMAATKTQNVTLTVKDAMSGKVIPNAEVAVYEYVHIMNLYREGEDHRASSSGTSSGSDGYSEGSSGSGFLGNLIVETLTEGEGESTGYSMGHGISQSEDYWDYVQVDLVKTNSKGVVTLKLEPGDYKVVAKATKPRSGAEYGYKNTAKKFTVKSGKNMSVTVKPKPYYGTYKITVKNAQTGKAANVKMCLKDADGNVVKSFKSGTSGYSSYIKPGKYRIVVNDNNYNKRTLATFTLEAGKSYNKIVTAIPVYKVNLKVQDKSGKLMKNKDITVTMTAEGMSDKSKKPNASGIAAYTKVPRGNVTVTAYRTVNGKKEILYNGTLFIKSETLGGTVTKTIKLNKTIK